MTRQAVIFIAAPGAGKNTQCVELAKAYNCYHFELSAKLEDLLKNPDPSMPEVYNHIQEIKNTHNSGKLWPEEVILPIVNEKTREIAKTDHNILYNGPFRRVSEAAKELPVTEECYGRENIHIIHLTISEEESIKRNVARRTCVNRHVIPDFEEFKNITVCPFDGAELTKRKLDDPETAKRRYDTYKAETEPVLQFFRDHNYEILTINGEQSIEQVHKDILTALLK